MQKENFIREKVQVQYKTSPMTFTVDDSVKAWGKDSEDLIAKLLKAEWCYEFHLVKNKVDRIVKVIYPQINNGHQGEAGHSWQWQLDVKLMGAGSTDRLYLDNVKHEIASQKVSDKKIKLGTDDYTVIEVVVKLTGKFVASKKH